MKKILFLLLFAPSFCFADTHYMATTGTNSGGGTEVSPWLTLQYAMSNMSGGDTLIIEDGIYTGTANSINGNAHQPPIGSSGAYTIIKARNDGAVVFDGEDTNDMFDNTPDDLTARDCYWQFEGIIWCNTPHTGVALTYSRYVKFLRCGNYDVGAGNITNFSASRSCDYVLFENCYSYGSGRYKFIAYQSSHIIFRSCVARMDWVDAYISPGNYEAVAGFSLYSASDSEVQNCIVIDSDQTDYWQNVGQLAGAFAVPSTDADALRVNFVNCVGLNIALGGVCTTRTEYHTCDDVTFTNCVIWDYPSWWPQDSVNYVRGLDDIYNHCTFGITASTESGYAFNSYDRDGSSNTTIKNSIIYSHTGQPAIYDVENFDYNAVYGNTENYLVTTPGANVQSTTNPIYNASTNPTGALKYITQIEVGSNLAGDADDSGDIGANIKTLIGTSGTLYGETGYATDTGVSMWPFPNETLIRTKMKAYSGGGVSGDRGFCADGETLTHYIMNYLGNGNPYGDGGTATTKSSTTGNVLLSGGVVLN